MDKYYKWKVLLIIVLVAVSIWKVYPPQEKINLGLDLQGGMQLLLQVEVDKVPAEYREDATDRVVEVIRNRIDEFGVREPVITKQGKDQIAVQLPGITDRDRAKEIVGKTAHLEFRLVSDNAELLSKAQAGTIPDGFEYKPMKEKQGLGEQNVLLAKEALLTGDHLTNAAVGFDQYGQPIVQLQFDKEGAKIFDQLTFQNIGKQLAIVLDGKIHSAPVIRDRIPSGEAQISGNFTADEASDLALVLRAGALPAPVHIAEERTVGPTLGRDSIEKSVKAGIVATLLVFIFMPAYYLLTGFIADIGLVVYIILVLGSLAIFHASLTLPGIAGFILSIGMAVDANILIAERMREELATGKTPRAAISAGYHRAFAAILDSNVTTLITSLLLFYFGTGPIKGFAVTLSTGLIACMFSSLVVSRVIFDFFAKRNPNVNLKMMKAIHVPNIQFLKGRFLAYGFSALTLIIGISAFFLRGQQNFGVEFTGGTSIQMEFKKQVNIADFRQAIEKQGVSDPSLQHFGDISQNQYVVKSRQADTKKIEQAARELAGEDFQVLRVDEVGPAVSGDLKTKALWAVFWSCIGILVYVGYRFEWKFALAAVVALLHDTLFTFGVYALSGREINLPIVAAILTIMGYSVNDTIVIFDRVRENLKIVRKKTFKEIVELSLNQTLGRTILTSMTVLFGSFALFFFGGGAINDFAFTLCVGFLIGIYSTIFVASALVVDWKAH
ncbi:MAG: protein translocase subunit SecD [Candidatus Omnitrophica bacterium]|nr:protein translocase subunit SecD [Candidatus Omnitrophota bacterium]